MPFGQSVLDTITTQPSRTTGQNLVVILIIIKHCNNDLELNNTLSNNDKTLTLKQRERERMGIGLDTLGRISLVKASIISGL